MFKKLKTQSDLQQRLMNIQGAGFFGYKPNSWGSISEEKFKQHLKDNSVHPDVIKKLEGAGFFSKLVDGIKNTADFVIKNKDNIEKGIKAGVQVYNTGRQLMGAVKGKGLNKKASKKGGKLMAGKLMAGKLMAGKLMAGKIKKTQRDRLNKVTKYRKQGYSMQEAWNMVKADEAK